ncbi:unnamed protein product [Rotaria sp. Silwood2]|nr:unnamed protein product [Rotaria sp. Silwood2]CAF4376609.1 unnamed protein product [Rotaria sp. Silwood2]
MGCIFGCDQPYDNNDDDIYIRDNHPNHHNHPHNYHNNPRYNNHRYNRRVVPHYIYCLNCRCQQYNKRDQSSNKCICGHTLNEHKII